MRFIVGFGRFWWDFIVGEDWKIAAGVVAVLTIGALLVVGTSLGDTAIALLTGVGILVVVTLSIVGGALTATRSRA
jgi:hypothetical protein